MSLRRQVRVASSFFDRLDNLLPEERGATGVASPADFTLHEIPPLIDLFAADYEAATLWRPTLMRAIPGGATRTALRPAGRFE